MVCLLEKQQTETKGGGRTVDEKAGMDHGGGHDHIYTNIYVYERDTSRVYLTTPFLAYTVE